MKQANILTIDKEKILFFIQFALLASIATLAPLFGQQAITGSIVNANLFVSTALLGVQAGILIGLLPSLVALSIGLLPPVLAPMIPFIMVGNTILVIIFNYLKETNYWLGVITASALKFIFLFSTSSIVIELFLKKEIAKKIATMMSWPQLLTALAGSLIAYTFLKGIKKI
jgi:hypothetical protein